MVLDRPLVREPLLPPAAWLNTPSALDLAESRGQVVLVECREFSDGPHELRHHLRLDSPGTTVVAFSFEASRLHASAPRSELC